MAAHRAAPGRGDGGIQAGPWHWTDHVDIDIDLDRDRDRDRIEVGPDVPEPDEPGTGRVFVVDPFSARYTGDVDRFFAWFAIIAVLAVLAPVIVAVVVASR